MGNVCSSCAGAPSVRNEGAQELKKSCETSAVGDNPVAKIASLPELQARGEAEPTKPKTKVADDWEDVCGSIIAPGMQGFVDEAGICKPQEFDKEAMKVPVCNQGNTHRPYVYGAPPLCNSARTETVNTFAKFHPFVVDAPCDPEVESILKVVGRVFSSPNVLLSILHDDGANVRYSLGGCTAGIYCWRWSFCAWMLTNQIHQALIVPDASKDARFFNNPYVQAGAIKFYCGTPLVCSNGQRLGVLCFFDDQVHPKFDAGMVTILNNLAELLVRRLEKDMVLALRTKDNQKLQELYSVLHRAVDSTDLCVLFLDVSGDEWKILYVNLACCKGTGINREAFVNAKFWDHFSTCKNDDKAAKLLSESISHQRPFKVDKLQLKHGSYTGNITLGFRPASRSAIDQYQIPVGVPTVVSAMGCETQPYYFVTIEGLPTDTPTTSIEDSAQCATGSYTLTSQLIASRMSTSSTLPVTIQEETPEIEGLELLHVLGNGVYGCVYKGTWFGTPVAVKVVDNVGFKGSQGGAISLEALLGLNLRHPHLLRTLKCVVRQSNRNSTYYPGHSSGSNAIASSGTYDMASADNNVVRGQSTRPAADVVDPGEITVEEDLASMKAARGSKCVIQAECTLSSNGANIVSGSHNALHSSDCNILLGETWLVQEFCDKGTLQDAVDRGVLLADQDPDSFVEPEKGVDLAVVLVTALEIANAMAHLHSCDIVHGNLSAYNVMLSSLSAQASAANRGWSVKVADFGLACHVDRHEAIQMSSYTTLVHMPPEALLEGTIGKETDVYSFGVLLWQIYMMSRPWVGLTHEDIIEVVGRRRAQLQWTESAPEAYVVLAQSCMQYEPQDRPSFDEICSMLQPLCEDM